MPERARVKNGHPPKICQSCQRPFEWRKKWRRDWPDVKYCSQACRKAGAGNTAPEFLRREHCGPTPG